MVGNTIGTKLIQLGYNVMMGSRSATNEKALAWVEANGANASAGTFEDAARFGEIIFNCTKGEAALEVFKMAGIENFRGKTIIDISNPTEPREIGYFDTVPYGENTAGFGGSWSNYPYFPSGTIIVTSGNEGLFILKKRGPVS